MSYDAEVIERLGNKYNSRSSAAATAPPATEAEPVIVGEIRRAHARGWAMTTLQGKAAIRKGWRSESPPVPLDQLIKHAKAGDNIGIRTGPASGVVVIDVDDLDAEVRLTDTVTANTGGGGRHYFYRYPESVPIGNSSAALGLPPGVHVRGDGGQVVMAGSTHPDTGARYAWASGRSPDDIELAPLPDELLARAVESQRTAKREPQPAQTRTADTQPDAPDAPQSGPPLPPPPPPAADSTAAWVRAALDNETTAVASAPEGQRNHTLNRAAFNLGQIVGGGALSRSEAEHALRGAAEACGLEHGEIAKTLRSGLDAGEKSPRSKPATPAAATPNGAASASEGDEQAGPVARIVAGVPVEPVRWLWPGRVARGKVTLFAGDPGLGKSFLSLDMASRVSTGSGWPDGPGETFEPGGVVLLSAEDDIADTIRPRLDAAGADSQRIVAMEAVRSRNGEGAPSQRPVDLSRDILHVEQVLSLVDPCKLVIIDPISAYLGDTDSHENAAVRGLLAQLAELAGRRGVAVVCISHLNKGSGAQAVYRVTGSLGFVAAARAVWSVTRDEQDPTRRLMLPVKNNLAADTDGLAYSLADAGTGTPQVHWEAEPVSMTADDAFAHRKPTAKEEAAKWLRDLLRERGPMSAKDIEAKADDDGHAWRTVRRAKSAAGVVSEQMRGDDRVTGWVWKVLDGQ